MQELINAKKMLVTKPDAIKRMGKKLFVEAPLYKSKYSYKAVYINAPLFKKLFASKRDLSFDDMAKVIEAAFNFTIEKRNAKGAAIGTAYVDRQADPLNLSLSGNLGSGRAYYAGKLFNIKGEKTPLATSDKRRFSDGLLEMERCLWETLVANAFQTSLQNGLNGVLAILDMDETCEVIWRDVPVRRGKIIRVDEDGSLDRVTHAFYNKKPLSKQDLKATAAAYGVLEADKFIERIVHGSWSPGNITLKGHLIDFDTVCTIKGRSPQYSSTQWHHENYFGYEHLGQLKILQTLTQDAKLNVDKVTFNGLKKILITQQDQRIAERLVFLMGFNASEKIYKKYKLELHGLATLWVELARKTYRKIAGLSVKDASSFLVHVFDFSAFFRIYPLYKRYDEFTLDRAMEWLCDTSLKSLFKDTPQKKLTDVEQPYRDAVMAVIGKDFVDNKDDLMMLKIAAVHFIKQYDALFTRITNDTNADLQEVEARSYAINEDRFYMFPLHTLTFQYVERERTEGWRLNCIMRALIEANVRDGEQRICDVRIYKEGYSFIKLTGDGYHQKGLCFFKHNVRDAVPQIDKNGEVYICQGATKYNEIIYLTDKIRNTTLAKSYSREKSLHSSKTHLSLH